MLSIFCIICCCFISVDHELTTNLYILANYFSIYFKSVNDGAALANADLSEPSTSLTFSMEALYVLSCLTIITRSIHNCKVFSYYGGVQKIVALLKGNHSSNSSCSCSWFPFYHFLFYFLLTFFISNLCYIELKASV